MKHHSLTTGQISSGWRCWCECGSRSDLVTGKQQAEDWGLWHHEQVRRARAHLRNRNPGLLDQYRWYKKQAERSEDSQERAMWLLLADGLEHRLGVPHEETPLFEETS